MEGQIDDEELFVQERNKKAKEMQQNEDKATEID